MPVTRLLYPLYQLGNPQLRIFRPNWFLTLVRPGKEQPPDTVQFRTPMEMTKYDIKNYLENIYNVPVGAVRTRIQFGSNKKRNHRNQKIKQPDYKVAYVQLGDLAGERGEMGKSMFPHRALKGWQSLKWPVILCVSGIPCGVIGDASVSSDAHDDESVLWVDAHTTVPPFSPHPSLSPFSPPAPSIR
ncbi:hypothetical protein NQZ68_026524 [Dissostichus eleginoides]|nr:hypothetical protein NQZ68_026524 [Dissostichus eleginoides]